MPGTILKEVIEYIKRPKWSVIIGLVVALFLALTLSACSTSDLKEIAKPANYRIVDSEQGDYRIATDQKTGCRYLVFDSISHEAGGITPLLKSNGTPDCPKTKNYQKRGPVRVLHK